VARARELTAEAENVLETDPELSIHLALAAIEPLREAGENTTQAVNTLRAAIAADRVLFQVPGGEAVAVSPDGQLLATADVEDSVAIGVAVWDIETAEIVDRFTTASPPLDLAFSPDGESLFVAFRGADQPVMRWDLTTGQPTPFGPEDTDSAVGFAVSPDSRLIAFATWTLQDDSDGYTGVWSLDDRGLVYRTPGWGPAFNADGLLSYVSGPEADPHIRVVDPITGDEVRSIATDLTEIPEWTSWSPDGTRIAAASQTDMAIYEVEEGVEVIRPTLDRVADPEWLPGGDALVVGGESAIRVIDAETGEIRTELLGQSGGTFYIEPVPGTDQFASAGFISGRSGTVIFDASPLGGVEVGGWIAPVPIGSTPPSFDSSGDRALVGGGDERFVTAGAVDGADAQVVEANREPWFPEVDPDGNFVAYGEPGGSWVVRSLQSDEVVYRAPDGWSVRGISADGTKVVMHRLTGNGQGRVRLVDTSDGREWDLDVDWVGQAWFSPDTEVAVIGNAVSHGGTAFFDASSGELLAHFADTPRFGGLTGAFTPDGTKALIGSSRGGLFVFDRERLLSGDPPPEALDREVEAHETIILRVVVSPDGTKATTSAWDEPLKLWDIETGQLVGEFGSGGFSTAHLADFHPTLPYLLVTTPPDQVRIHTLDIDQLVEIARSKLSRDMTGLECQQYFREPCPTAASDD
jgi:WD40 repeat protein